VNKLALRMSGARGIFVHFNSLENLYILHTGAAASYLPTVQRINTQRKVDYYAGL